MDPHTNHTHVHIMGTLLGHIGPGGFFLLFGVFHYSQALLSSTTATWLRTPFAYIAKIIFITVSSGVGWFVEYALDSDVSLSPWYSRPHLWMFFCVFFGGLIALLNLFNVLHEPSWCISLPIGVFAVGITFFTHDESSPLNNYVHQIIAVITSIMTLTYTIEFTVRHQPKFPWNSSNLQSSCTCCLWKVTLKDLNIAYVNPTAYDTIFPSLNGYITMLLGIFWIVIGVAIYEWQYYTVVGQAKNIAFALFISSVCLTSVIALVLSITGRLIDFIINKYSKRNTTSDEVKDRIYLISK